MLLFPSPTGRLRHEVVLIDQWFSLASVFGMSTIVFAAAVIQAALGMGYGMTAAPLLALLNPVFVPAPTILIGMITSSAGAWSEREGIQWREVGIASFGRLIGAMGAALLIHHAVDDSSFLLFFGLLTAVAVAISASGWRLSMSSGTLLAMGSVSGLMGTITGVGAPPLALIYSNRPAASSRPTLAAIFAIGCGLSIVGLALVGWLGFRDLIICSVMLPAMVAGTLVGRRIRGLAASRYRTVLLSIAGISAILLIIKGLIQSFNL